MRGRVEVVMWNSARFVALGGWVGSAGKAKCGLASSICERRGGTRGCTGSACVDDFFALMGRSCLSISKLVKKRSVTLRVFPTCVFHAVTFWVEMALWGGVGLADSRLKRYTV